MNAVNEQIGRPPSKLKAWLPALGAVVALLIVLVLLIVNAIVGSLLGTFYQAAAQQACVQSVSAADPSVPQPATDPAASLDVSVATWNVLKSNRVKNVLAGIAAIEAGGADVIGLQELTPAVRTALVHQFNKRWAISAGNNAVQILWRRDRLTRVAQGSTKVFDAQRLPGRERGPSGRAAGPKHLQWVQFRTAAGASFALINHHLLPGIETHGRPDPKAKGKVRLAGLQMEAALEQADELQTAGVPVVITGDHNIAALADSKVKNSQFPYVRYAKHGIYSNWRVLGYPKKTGTQSRGKRLIDYVFSTSKTLIPTSQRILGRHGSDHKAVLVQLSNKSTKPTGAKHDTDRPVDVVEQLKPNISNVRQQQIANARLIRDGVLAAGGDGQALDLALIAAAAESDTLSLDRGDQAGPDSRGVFQQRDSWGTLAQRMDPKWAAGAFMLGPHQQGRGGLLQVPKWREMTPTAAIHAVQRNANKDHYSAFVGRARELAAAAGIDLTVPATTAGDDITAAVPAEDCQPGTTGSTDCAPTHMTGESQGLTPDALLVLRCVATTFGQVEEVGTYPGHQPDQSRAVDIMIPGDYDSTAGHTLGLQIAAWVRDHATELGVDYVIFDQKIWSSARSSEGWRACGTSAAGCYAGSDDSAAHRDHVHVSVFGDQATGLTPTGPTSTGGPQLGGGACPLDRAVAAGHTPSSSCNQALTFLQQQMAHPTQSWSRRCLALVMQAYGYAGGAPTAYQAGLAAQRAGQLNLDRSNIPRGAVLYWDGRSRGNTAGHVAISDGQGHIYSNDVTGAGKVGLVDDDFPERVWGQTFMGWSGPYFPAGTS